MLAPAKSYVDTTTEFDELVDIDGFENPYTSQIIGAPGFNTKVALLKVTDRDDGNPSTCAFATPPTDIEFLALLQVASPEDENEANFRPATRTLIIPRERADAPADPGLKETASDTEAPLVAEDRKIAAYGNNDSSSVSDCLLTVMMLCSGARV